MSRRLFARSALLAAVATACQPPAGRDGLPARRTNDPITVALASPVGVVKKDDRQITWHAAPGVSRYEVVVSDSIEAPIFSAVTRDTQVTIPDGFQYSLTQNYRWYVTAYRDRDSTAWRSPIAVFRLEGEGRRMPPMPKP